ncbi:hypothetical protein GW17_00048613 [Ensete ventricosum]|nr:hypothetical protein GW17_00048613 [Ensete ventricosum]
MRAKGAIADESENVLKLKRGTQDVDEILSRQCQLLVSLWELHMIPAEFFSTAFLQIPFFVEVVAQSIEKIGFLPHGTGEMDPTMSGLSDEPLARGFPPFLFSLCCRIIREQFHNRNTNKSSTPKALVFEQESNVRLQDPNFPKKIQEKPKCKSNSRRKVCSFPSKVDRSGSIKPRRVPGRANTQNQGIQDG